MSHKPAYINSPDARKTKKELLAELQELRAQLSVLKNDNSDLKALPDGEARLRAMIDASPVPMVAFTDNQIILVNRMFTDTFGYTLEDIPTLDYWWLLAYPNEEYRIFVVRRWDNAVEPAIRDRTYTTPREVVVQCKNGSQKNVMSYFSSIGDLNLSVLYDITGIKQAEEALRASEEKYRGIVETAVEGIWICDIDVKTLFVNNRIAKMLGYAPEEMLGRSAYEFMDDEAAALAKRYNVERRDHGLVNSYEQRYRRKDGTTLWAIVSASPMRDSEGRISSYLAMITDITDRKRAEETLLVSRRSLEKSREVTHVGSWELDTATGRIERSAESYRVFGLPPGEGMNDYQDFLSFIVPEDRERIDNIIRSSERNGEPYTVTYGIRRKDGEYRILFSKGESIKDASGHIGRMFGINQDVTEQKQAEREINEARMKAELYLDLMGHDISNMHQIAMNQLELAQEVMEADGELKVEERELIDTPLETLARSARLIENVRNLQKIRRGEFKEEQVDLNDLLSNVVKEYSAMVPDNSIEYMPDGRRPVMANKLLHDVFSNLVGNAIKHSNGNGTKISILLENASSNGNDYYKVSVEDNGPGVPDDMKNRIFNRLERGQTSTKGMGLGLYLVRSLVESYHGKVWVEDRINGDHTKGARFVVVLPAVEH